MRKTIRPSNCVSRALRRLASSLPYMLHSSLGLLPDTPLRYTKEMCGSQLWAICSEPMEVRLVDECGGARSLSSTVSGGVSGGLLGTQRKRGMRMSSDTRVLLVVRSHKNGCAGSMSFVRWGVLA